MSKFYCLPLKNVEPYFGRELAYLCSGFCLFCFVILEFWTQSLMLAKQALLPLDLFYHLVLGISKIRSLELFRWAGFEPWSSWIARITDVSHQHWLQVGLLRLVLSFIGLGQSSIFCRAEFSFTVKNGVSPKFMHSVRSVLWLVKLECLSVCGSSEFVQPTFPNCSPDSSV
jgi:hypothetical protein